MKRSTIFVLLGIVLILISIVFTIHTLGSHSGVTAEQITETLPGDDIIPDPWISIDRAATIPASASTTWPWVAQLGKDRAGWYAPLWIENTLHDYSASSTLPQFQNVYVGEVVPDWGGGSLKVLAVKAGSYVVYGSIHAPAGSVAAANATTYDFTWALVLENDTASSTSFHLRLRLPRPLSTSKYSIGQYIPPSLPGMIDYATDVVMFAGLQEQLR